VKGEQEPDEWDENLTLEDYENEYDRFPDGSKRYP